MEDYAKEIETISTAMEAIDQFYPPFKKIDSLPGAIAVLMTMLDTWAADHDVADEEVHEMLKATIETVRPGVFSICGRAMKSPE